MYEKTVETYKGFNICLTMTGKSHFFDDSRERVFGDIPELKRIIEERIKDGFYLLYPGMEPGEIEEKIKKIKKEEET